MNMWQRAKFLPPTESPEPFWVRAEPPIPMELPALNAQKTGFENERVAGLWYRTNVLSPDGSFCLWAPQNGVELMPEFADEVPKDDRYLMP